MADKSNCKLKISIADGIFEVSGSKKFVKSQIAEFKEVIDDMLETAITHYDILNEELLDDGFYDDEFYDEDFEDDLEEFYNDEFDDVDFDEDVFFEGEEDLPVIFSEEDEDIIISGEIPGDNKSARTINAALLYAYARQIQGSDEASVDEIRKVCMIHEFLDSSNFSTYIKSGAPKLYEDRGKGENRVLILTKKGRKKAEKLIDEITVK